MKLRQRVEKILEHSIFSTQSLKGTGQLAITGQCAFPMSPVLETRLGDFASVDERKVSS
jgi:hypothetical protein